MTLEELDTPAVVVDLDVLEDNIQRLAAYCRRYGLGLRPHTKTHKSPVIANMQLASGSQGITVAKVGEAEVMARAGIHDILVAYPVIGLHKLERLTRLAQRHRVAVSLDSLEVAEGISEAARRAGCRIRILVELDVGMGRCGIQSVEEWVRTAQGVDRLPGLDFAGLMCYPGHIWDPPSQQIQPLADVSARLQETLEAARRAGLECSEVSGGSTPTAFNSHLVQGMTEIRSGTYIFNDMNETRAGFSSVSQCALKVLVTVVSTAADGTAIVDGGSKTFSGDRLMSGDRKGFGHVTQYPDVQFIAQWEEHGQLAIAASSQRPRIGEKLTIIPNHACTCVNMHDRIYYHRGGAVEGAWTVDGRGKIQ